MSDAPPPLPAVPPPPCKSGRTAFATFLAILGAILVIGAAKWIGRVAENSAGRQAAMKALERDAVASGAPAGLFGTRWLMSMSEVMHIARSAQRQSPDSLMEMRPFYDRKAIITYDFTDDVLLMISVTFLGASSDADFDRTQARLSADYGSMPASAPSKNYKRSSRREANRFVIDHCVTEPVGVPTEQILFYRSK